jgi:hypothetical protein
MTERWYFWGKTITAGKTRQEIPDEGKDVLPEMDAV